MISIVYWTTIFSAVNQIGVIVNYFKNVGIVRPPAAGTKEQPDYQFDKDALKAKMAMFQKESTNEYKPRNQIKKDEKKVAAVRFFGLVFFNYWYFYKTFITRAV